MATSVASFRVPERFWDVPVHLPFLQPPLTEQIVADAEERLGMRLPAAYLAALRIQNGGYVRLSRHPSVEALVKCISGIGPRFPSLLKHDWTNYKRRMKRHGLRKPERIDDLLPFSGDSHYFFCFDYRHHGRDHEPRITYVDVETFRVDKVLASDFGEFLGQLQPGERRDAYGFVTDMEASAVAKALSLATGFLFDDQGDGANGYRVFRAGIPGASRWAWLTPNRVRRGFVRDTNREYEQLRALFPEMVHRFPEHADCSYVLTCSDFEDDMGRVLVRGVQQLPFPSRKIVLNPD